MARPIGKLTSLRLDSLIKAAKGGMTSDGGGLYFRIDPRHGGKSWVFRYRDKISCKLRDKGMGPYPALGLKDARAEAGRLRTLRAQGVDPINAQRKALQELKEQLNNRKTFGECAASLISVEKHGWSNKTLISWNKTITIHCKPLLKKAVCEISAEDIAKVLQPIWFEKTYTGTRVRGRIASVFDHARERRYFSGDNPAVWRGAQRGLLPKPSSIMKVEHHPSMPYTEIADFLERLSKIGAYEEGGGLSVKALAMTILTACRVSEVTESSWEEFNLEAAVWEIPKERMKSGEPHTVPLSADVIKILKTLHPRDYGYVFPSGKDKNGQDKSITIAAPYSVLKSLAPEYTVHGFRATFRSWAGALTDFPREVAEAALAHAVKDKVEAAYMRDKYLAKRRQLMDTWASYCNE